MPRDPLRTPLFLLLVLALGCTGTTPSAPPASKERPSFDTEGEPFNSDGSPKVLPPGPPSEPPYTLVLSYDDFGPQSLSFSLLGFDWWQWEAGGSWEPGDSFDVRVVVYRDRSREEVEKAYPTIKNKSDYRYVSYEDALAFLDEALQDEGLRGIGSVHRDLQETREKILAALGPLR